MYLWLFEGQSLLTQVISGSGSPVVTLLQEAVQQLQVV